MSELAKRGEGQIAPMEPWQPRPASIFDVIQNAALRPDVDIDKMERLYAMHAQELARQAEADFHDAFAAAQAEMRPVAAQAWNDQTRSKYAKLDAIARAIDPIIAKHGLGRQFGQADCPKDGHYRVTMTLTRGGHSKEFWADIPIDATGMKGNINKTATHAFGSTMSYGRRYVKLLAFDIATGDDDDGQSAGGKASGPVSPEQLKALSDRIDELGINEARFLAHLRVDALENLPSSKFDDAMHALNTSKQAEEKKAREKGAGNA